MDRRRFLLASLAGAVLAAPLAAGAQQAGKIHQIGFLPAGAGAAHRQQLEALREGLRELGYIPDKTIVITAVWPETPSGLQASAASLVRRNPEVTLGVDLRLLKVARVEDLAAAIVGLHPQRDGGLIVLPTTLALSHARAIAELALRQKLPTIGDYRSFADGGGLIVYGVDQDDQLRRATTYVDRILKGARPGDLPVQQPLKFQLVINLKTAKALGLTIPQSLLARAGQVLE